MSKKLQKRVNGGLAIYFGIGSTLSSIIAFFAILVMIYKDVFQSIDITLGVYLMIIVIFLISSAMAYALLRVGYEEIEN